METKDRTLKNKKKISVVVVTYNSSSLISECLGSLINGCSSLVEIIVIDNASFDQPICRLLANQFSNIKFIANQRNIGYGAAVNQGIKLASGDYVFFMNPDVVVPEGTIEKLVAFMESHPDCGACAPHIKTPTKPWWFRWIFLRMPIDVAMGKIRKRGNHYERKSLLGCAVLIKRDFFLRLGGFDEGFFLYGEDMDLGWRIGKYGKSNCVVLSSPVIHFHAKSSATLPIRERARILAEARWRLASKYNSLPLKILCLIYNPIQRFLCWLVSWVQRG